MRRELQVLARELVASLEFYQGQPGSLPISEILLAGGTSRIPGLAAELERLTRVRVRLADPLVRVEVDDARREPRRPGVAGRRDRTGGGGLMRAVNLLPEQEPARRHSPTVLTTKSVLAGGASRARGRASSSSASSFVQSHGKVVGPAATRSPGSQQQVDAAQGRPGPRAPPSRAATRPGSPPSRRRPARG